MSEPLKRVLHRGLEELDLGPPAGTEDKLIRFIGLLSKWNKAYNLTAIRDPLAMITHHILDSLAVVPFLKGTHVIDIGTGAGLPGIPLAMMRPACDFTLLDSNAKKTRFVIQAKAELGLDNVNVVNERVERFRPTRKFATLVTRAFASLPEILHCSAHLCADEGEFLAMKGAYPKDELEQVAAPFKIIEVHRLTIPGLSEERHLVHLAKN